MRKKISKLTWALLILAGGLTGTLTPKNADALTCFQYYQQCTEQCAADDSYCFETCRCEFLNCRGYQCN